MEIADSPRGHDIEENGDENSKNSSRYRSRDGKKSSRREEKDNRSKEKERESADDRISSRDRRKGDREERDKDRRREDREEYEKDRSKHTKGREKERDHGQHERHKDKERERDRERDRKDRGKEKDPDQGREVDEKQRGKEKSSREKEREKEMDRLKDKDREKSRDKERDRKMGGIMESSRRDRDVDTDVDKEKLWEREGVSRNGDALDNQRLLDDKPALDTSPGSGGVKHDHTFEGASDATHVSASELEERILKAKEERLKKKPEAEGVSEVLAWVGRSRKLTEKRISEKEKARQLSKVFEEQDNMVQGDMEDETEAPSHSHHLAGVKVLHGLDKVIEGGAVVLTLKDQDILANGDINEDVDMLENVEIGLQKRRDEAYKASKKKTGIYDDKFNDDPGYEKKMLPQYDEPVHDEGITLGAGGRLTEEAERKLEELRKRLQGSSTTDRFEDLTSSAKVSSDYYTQEEMLQFKKPKKRKSLRKKEKLDLDALEAEAKSSGLGAGDIGSRNDGKRQAIKQDRDRIEAEKRKSAYESAQAKAQEASRLLRAERILPMKTEENETPVIADDEEDLHKSLERARKLALKKQDKDGVSGPKAIALLATATQSSENENPAVGDAQENTVVITEMEEFVWGLQLNEESRKPDTEDVFTEEDEAPVPPSDNEMKDEPGGWTEVKEVEDDEGSTKEEKEEVVPDETIHEAAVGKGLSGALKLLKERGTLKETVEWGGRNMDKKKSKLVGIADDGTKEIRIERTDEFGRRLTPKESFRNLSHKFHGKGPGKMKQEKRMKQYLEEQKLKQMKNSDTPSLSAERMRVAQAQLKTPYLVLSGHVKTGQDSDPRGGFGTVEKDPGSLTPMLGDRKVEHFLGIKRKAEPSNLGPGKKSKP